ncbi:MAG: rhodanese-like domain-containing protein [Chitinophagales bacterium]|nr:rhodanese-like domain-containing protein [Chitinophagales bacterium]
MEYVQSLVNEICPTSSQAWVKRGAILVDVRELNEVEQLAFDVPAVVHIPLSEFEIRYKELAMDKELVIVCRSGSRSLRAAGFLINHGFDPIKVVNMKHGMIRWVQRGFPVKGDISGIVDANAGGCCNHGGKKESGCC